MRREGIDQPAEFWICLALMRKPAEQGALAAARGGAAVRHVGGLVPIEHRAGRTEIADLEQPLLELGELVFGRAAVGCFAGGCAGFARAGGARRGHGGVMTSGAAKRKG